MKMSLLHALAALLTLLMLVVRQRHALAATCSYNINQWKPLKAEAQKWQMDRKVVPSRRVTHCSQQTSFYERPKYKKDPEINIDNEEIGQCPCED